jgi:hypothetical protein
MSPTQWPEAKRSITATKAPSRAPSNALRILSELNLADGYAAEEPGEESPELGGAERRPSSIRPTYLLCWEESPSNH